MTPLRRKTTRDSLALAVTQYLVRAMSMARNFVAAKLLDPTSYGAWNALQLMMDYGAIAPLGTQQGLDQMVPARIVEGDPERLARAKRAALFNVVVLTLLFTAFGLGWASVGSSRMRVFWGLGGLAVALFCVLLVNVANVGTGVLRSHGDIGGFARWFVLQGLIGSGLGLALMVPFGRWGLLWGWLAGCLVAYLFVAWRGRRLVPLLPAPALECFDLIQIGLPLYIFTASGIVMRNIDRIVVLRFLGTQALGYYGLSVNVLTLLMAVPDSLVYVVYPQLVRRISEASGDPAAIRDRVERLVRGVAIGLPALAGLCALWARDLVHALLPRYDACVPPLQMLAFGATGLAMSSFGSVVLMTVGRRIILVPAAVFLAALSGGLQLLSLRWHGGLTGVAAASSAAYLVSGGVLLALAAAGLGHPLGKISEFLARTLAPTGVAALACWGALQWLLPLAPGWPGWDQLLRLVLLSFAFLVVYGLLASPFARGIGFRSLVAEWNLPWLGRRGGSSENGNG